MRYVLLLLAIVVIVGCSPALTEPVVQQVTIYGYDSTGYQLGEVNVWDDYARRERLVAQLHDGDKVGMVRREKPGVLIETSDGTRGWVSEWYIKEFQ